MSNAVNCISISFIGSILLLFDAIFTYKLFFNISLKCSKTNYFIDFSLII